MKRKYKVYIILVNLLLAGVFGSVYGYYITTRIDSSLVVVSIIFLAFLGTALQQTYCRSFQERSIWRKI
ncbi:MAG: hypothetical protein JST46_10400 [Bacteroidetes bacterium]|nr:hypothetical protein [Bacteroidota bacterium]